jgi:hypothetical protein
MDRRARRIALALAAAWALAGCVTVKLDRPAAQFGAAVGDASEVVGTYLRSLDDFERRLYLDVALYDSMVVLATNEAGKPTPLVRRTFGTASIQARVDAVTLLAAYADRLTDLATSDAPSKATDAGAALGVSLAGVAQRFQGLPAADKTAPSYAGPLETVVGALGATYVEEKRDAALRRAVKDAAPAVDRIVALLETDLVEAAKPLRETGEAERLSVQIRFYNANRQALATDVAARRALLDDIDGTVRRIHAIADFDPTQVTRALRASNAALVKLATSPRRPEDLKAFSAVMEVWGNRISAAAKAARALDKKE